MIARAATIGCLVVLLGTGCAGLAPVAFEEVRRSPRLQTNLSEAETESILEGLETWLARNAAQTRLRRLTVTTIQAESEAPLLMIVGCGTFKRGLLPEHWVVSVDGVRRDSGWEMNSWQVDTHGIHGPRIGCRRRSGRAL